MQFQYFVLFILSIIAYVNTAVFQNYVTPGDEIHVSLKNKQFTLKSTALDLFTSPADFESEALRKQLEVAENIYGRSIIADAIKNLLEAFRDIVINGNENVPALDPLIIDNLGPYTYSATGIRASLGFRDFNLEGLRWYVVDEVSFIISRLTFGLHLTVPRLALTGSYDAEARIALLITHRAGGNYRIFINRIELGLDARLGTNILGGGHLVLRELGLKIFIADVNIHIEGMVGSSIINNFINNLIQGLTQDIVNNELENISQSISEQLFDVVNEFLKDFTLDDLLSQRQPIGIEQSRV